MTNAEALDQLFREVWLPMIENELNRPSTMCRMLGITDDLLDVPWVDPDLLMDEGL